MPNPVVHLEILGPDGAELIRFYQRLFASPLQDGQLPGWPHYGLIEEPDRGIGGAVGSADAAGGGAAVLVYVEVDDPQAYIDGATEMGASFVLPVTNVPGTNVTVAWLKDPQGNLLGLVKGSGG